jgi:hypothetical protein
MLTVADSSKPAPRETARYDARILREIETKPGSWHSLEVEVVRNADRKVVGTYRRDYPQLFRTFHPFVVAGRDLALYSPDYTATRVMELPSCRDIGGETPIASGFCPVDYYIPQSESREPLSPYGFVAGCVWGDDSTWKIQVLDLRDVAKGLVRRDERLGYIELPRDLTLEQAIRIHAEPWMYSEDEPDRPEWSVEIATLSRYRLDDGAPVVRER